jgi:pilus assembly protein CpaC
VRVSEVARSLEERIGVDWASIFGGGSVNFGLLGGPAAFGGGAFTGVLSIVTDGVDFNLFIDALKSEGLVSILAEPSLTAISGESASFLAGGEFPIPISQEEGVTTVEYKEFGVSLVFTPTLIGDGRISLKVAPEVSELDFSNSVEVGGFAVPALTVRRASTTVELSSGQSFAIAGLLQNTSSEDIDKLPFLGELPILGALFRSNTFLQGQSELVIIVTPYIVEPAARPSDLQVPTAGLAPPNEIERILRGEFQSPAAPHPEAFAAPTRLFGTAGFMLE